jgi:hypothetical protein
MKNLLFLALIISLFACSKSEDEMTPDPTDPGTGAFDPAAATLISQGTFAGSGSYTVSGSAKLYEFQGKRYIYLENFSSSGGPDLRVYLATNTSATQFVSLGNLKANSGNQSYVINNPPDFAQYKNVLIWCQQFTVLFGASTLK